MKRLLALLVLATAMHAPATLAHGPSRLRVTEEIHVAAPPEKVWAVISDFCSIERWHPAIAHAECEGGNAPGATRVLTLTGGGVIHEALKKYQPEKMTYKYAITDVDVKVLPVTTYHAFLSVHPDDGGGSIVRWKGGFYRGYPKNEPPPELNDEAAIKAVTGVYRAGLAEIKRLAEGDAGS